MIFLLLLLIAVAMTTATYLSAIRRQKRDWRAHGRASKLH